VLGPVLGPEFDKKWRRGRWHCWGDACIQYLLFALHIVSYGDGHWTAHYTKVLYVSMSPRSSLHIMVSRFSSGTCYSLASHLLFNRLLPP
jgi:hypothetical protein